MRSPDHKQSKPTGLAREQFGTLCRRVAEHRAGLDMGRDWYGNRDSLLALDEEMMTRKDKMDEGDSQWVESEIQSLTDLYRKIIEAEDFLTRWGQGE